MKNYEVKSVKYWGGNKTKKRNEEGELAMSLTFEEHPHEPVDYFSKQEVHEGDSLYGEIVEYRTAKGQLRKRFVTEELKKKENMKQNTIQAQWAIGQALQFASNHTNKKEIRDLAELYIEIVEEIV